MSTNKHVDLVCVVLILAILAGVLGLFAMGAFSAGTDGQEKAYETGLFNTDTVHTMEITMDDWEGFLAECENEEYVMCTVTIDGETLQNVGIRAKGNTSLSQVKNYGNDRYSFKVEFDHYQDGLNYQGMDKLSLNNIIQDNTYMKDYLSYQLMGSFGVDAPLCSYIYLTVNGEDWGLYLAVEAVEESFLERNYGDGAGELYKPDSTDMGGGRGAGDDFEMPEDFAGQQPDGGQTEGETPSQPAGEGADGSDRPDPGTETGRGGGRGGMEKTAELSALWETLQEEIQELQGKTLMEGIPVLQELLESETGKARLAQVLPEEVLSLLETLSPMVSGDGKGGFSMGSDDVKLIYTDDDFDSYSNLFDNAKTDVTDADKTRLIQALKTLNQGEDPASAVNTEEVIRYFVVHNFVCNFDSYTGSMIHNYYLYEEDGVLSMIPWDYNLAFGGFQQGGDATSLVNYPIDSPVSGGSVEDRPMIAWIFADETYTQQYHDLFSQFIAQEFESGAFEAEIDRVKELIAPYVEKDPTKFCTYEEFETGVATLKSFCLLRAQSVRGQLEGTIPSTSDGQSADSSALIDASAITISDMGSMNAGGMEGMGGGPGGAGDGQQPPEGASPPGEGQTSELSPPDQGSSSTEDPAGASDRGSGGPGNAPDTSGQSGGGTTPPQQTGAGESPPTGENNPPGGEAP